MNRVVLDLRDAARAHRIPVPTLPHLVQSARATWTGRMVQEYGSGHVFESLAGQLEKAGFPSSDVNECGSSRRKRDTTGSLCGAVVESLGGAAWAEVDAPLPVPRHDDVDRTEAVLRNLLSVSCISETVAVSLIAAERVEMPAGPLRELSSRASGPTRLATRASAGGSCASALRLSPMTLADGSTRTLRSRSRTSNATSCRSSLCARSPPEGLALGLCNGAEARTLFYDTVDTVIVPGLRRSGWRGSEPGARRGRLRRAGGVRRGRAVTQSRSQAAMS